MDYRALDELPSDESEPEPVFSGSHPKQPRKHHWWIVAIIIIVVIALIVGGTAIYLLHYKKQTPAQSTQQSTQQSSQQPMPTPSGSTSSSTYTSNGKDLNLSFTYPSNWSATPPSGNNPNDQAITLNSPLVSLASANGQATTGKVVVAIRPGATTASELASDKAVTSQASVQFAYTKPTASQHQYPFLTFVNLEGGQNPNSFDEVIITGVTSFAKGQSVLPESVTQIDPLITARFYTCSTSSCDTSASSSLAITNTTWQSDATCKQIKDLFASLQLN
jgi:cytoskeletal protein RodZ